MLGLEKRCLSNMIIGCPKEIKNHEYRVGLVPAVVDALQKSGHEVIIENNAGAGSGFSNEAYEEAGAKIIQDSKKLFCESEMIIKVKEPQAEERKLFRSDQLLFTYLHLAPDKEQTNDLIKSKITAIAYETITDSSGKLPLLAPMSVVAGRLAPQMGAWALQKSNGGGGILLAGLPGVIPASVLIIGGGVVGTEAASVAAGMGANVTVLDKSVVRLEYLNERFGNKINTCFASESNIEELLKKADLVIGAVLIPGATAPKVIKRSQLKIMRSGSVLLDVAIDQGGCFETSKPTTHEKPIYEVDDVIHYCVANMPSSVARTSTLGLANVTMPFILTLANKGWKEACASDYNLLNGVNLHNGKVTNQAVGLSLGLETYDPKQFLS